MNFRFIIVCFFIWIWCPLLGWGNDQWKLLDCDQIALEARIELIANARCDINLMCYDIDDGKIVSLLLQQLRQQAANGVRVRLLVDELQSQSALQRLAGSLEGIEVRVFNPVVLTQPLKINRRLHSKLMVVDRQSLILGSRNLTDKHFGVSEVNFIDCDVLLEGMLALHAQAYFDWVWVGPYSVPFSVSFDPVQPSQNPSGIDPDYFGFDEFNGICLNTIDAALNPDLGSFMVDTDRLEGDQAQLLHDATLNKKDSVMSCQVIRLIDCARHEVWIESPYPAFSRPFSAAITRALRRGVRVNILTNSIATTDKISTQAAFQNQKAAWIRKGAVISEFRGCNQLHAKTLIVDRSLAWIGSYNFDARSDRLNLELVLQVCDPIMVDALLRATQQRHVLSKRVVRRRPTHLSSVAAKDRVKFRIFQTIMPLLRPHL